MYYLDTTFLIDLLQKKSRTFEILKKITDSVLTTGTINVHEYLVGGYGAKDEIRELKARRKVLSKILILPYDEKSAEASSLIESSLRKSGEMIGTADILIGRYSSGPFFGLFGRVLYFFASACTNQNGILLIFV